MVGATMTYVEPEVEGDVLEEEPHGGPVPSLIVLRESLSRPAEGTTPVVGASEAASFAGLTDTERDALYAELRPLVRRLTRQYGDTYEMRQDLEGEIYCRFCELLRNFDPRRGVPLKAYIVRQLISSVYTYARSHWRRRRREVSLEQEVDLNEQPASGTSSLEWDQELVKQEIIKALPEAIAGLPHRQRQVVIWRFYELRSYEDIAEILGVRPATVRSLMRHGLNNLRRHVNLSRLATG